MKAYKVQAVEGDVVVATRYAGSQAQVRELRDQLMEQFDVKRKQVSSEEVEIPTGKAELLEFINTVAAEADLTVEE